MPGPWPAPMKNPIRHYEWGSTTVLARLQGRRPTGEPEAELWMGAHRSAPSRLVGPDGEVSLDAAVAEHGLDLLGSQVHERFGDRLPFLLKLLAIAKPLSVQVHPTAERARTGFQGEIEVKGEHRYSDPYPKPEMLYALEPVDALCGFRGAAEAGRLTSMLGGDRSALLAALLVGHGEEPHLLESVLRTLVTWPEDDRTGLVEEVVGNCRRRLAVGAGLDGAPLAPADRRTLIWTCRLGAHYPKDPLVAAPFLLDLVRLEPGEVLYVPAGAPHAYLYGLGVEIMANSDNVLRAGLTHKPVAVDEMLHIVDGDSRPHRDVPFAWLSPHEVAWLPPAEEFQLSRIWMTDAAPVAAFPGIAGPQVLLCTSGPVQVRCLDRTVALDPGESAFVGAGAAGTISLSGPGEVFRASAGGQRLPRSR